MSFSLHMCLERQNLSWFIYISTWEFPPFFFLISKSLLFQVNKSFHFVFVESYENSQHGINFPL